ncbi:MAG: hypothetical protein QMD14_04220 [Candidatus Aenigmarchaeota archaeon]|nr:hypothetical protein [Candidatus Aenigmarchaeota archaeon]
MEELKTESQTESSEKGFTERASGMPQWMREKGYTSWHEYKKDLARRKGLGTYHEYVRYRALMKVLKEYRVAERFGEDVFDAILEECRAFVKEKRKARKRKPTVAAMTYKVLMERKEPIEVDYVAECYGVNRWELLKYFKNLYGMEKISKPDVESYIRKYARELGLPDESAIQFYEKNKDILRRFKATSIAATCVYLTDRNCRITRSEVAEKAKTTPQTITSITRVLRENKRLDYAWKASKITC